MVRVHAVIVQFECGVGALTSISLSTEWEGRGGDGGGEEVREGRLFLWYEKRVKRIPGPPSVSPCLLKQNS